MMMGPEGDRCGGKSTDRMRKSVVPVSARVWMTLAVWFEVGEEEFVF